ncbi:ADP-ribosyl-[dinitrogen reductase] hydrolase [Paenibacillus phyllosphaerae]|uniref:ADP-ribosyl-[dinitrogen reductase] hydrolase n=1 Tax=Paenibacillus phyllosphaerae TaxID=274593 RepID=A0A7W5FNM0_9BACL|nr:ADP-ribosylglycohydrolase family protein [Paenibacillus phyllosphaerae]MBB3111149.1 ADP-ribosyl-[dinitrogen reductase] hydrolase [Paenibacillus phyllosphaerae]
MEETLFNRMKGGLFGVAVGDALGGTTEFMSAWEIKQKHGYLDQIVGGGVWRLEPGEVTDDTMMTLCVAEGILEEPDQPYKPIGDYFMKWFQSNPKDIGNIIRAVFHRYEGDWFEAALVVHEDFHGRSAGNGSLMRCLPVALIYPRLAEMERITHMQSKMTHYDDRCNEACRIYNRIAYRLLNGEELRAASRTEIQGSEYEDIEAAGPACETSGYVVDTFRWVLHALLTTGSFAEAVELAANEGGDSDTIGAIAGGLAGIYYGYDGIPGKYADKLLMKYRLAMLAERMMTLRTALAARV